MVDERARSAIGGICRKSLNEAMSAFDPERTLAFSKFRRDPAYFPAVFAWRLASTSSASSDARSWYRPRATTPRIVARPANVGRRIRCEQDQVRTLPGSDQGLASIVPRVDARVEGRRPDGLERRQSGLYEQFQLAMQAGTREHPRFARSYPCRQGSGRRHRSSVSASTIGRPGILRPLAKPAGSASFTDDSQSACRPGLT